MRLTWFRFDAPAAVADWSPIDDAVMGGRSASRLRADPAGHAVFEGQVSLLDGGGFASVRTWPLPLGLAGAQACVIEVCGDGRGYKLNLRSDDAFDGVNHQARFQPPPGAWTTLRLPLSAFAATWRGRPVPGAPALNPEHLRQVGLMTADRQPGPFALAVRAIGLD